MTVRALSRAALPVLPLLALAAAVPVAQSIELSATPTLTSDYDFRGISLSTREPAFQLSLDAATASGFKANAWLSNTDIGVPGLDVELDLSVGWAGESGGFNWDTGVVWYTYPDNSALNYPEAFIGASRNFGEKFTAGVKVWYSWDYGGSDEEAYYLDTNFSFALPAGFALTAHAGFSQGDYWDLVFDDGYLDYSIGVTKSVDKLDFAVRFIDGSDLLNADPIGNVNATDSKVVLSVSTKLPWKD
jgi:uncharacterized protein (TIGR02001 family)